jgi:MFS family permease
MLAVPEALTGNNFWEGMFGKVDDLVKVPTGQRYDFLHRAMGATRHPIFFAIVMMLLVPWSVALLRDQRQREWRYLGWAGLGGAIIAMLATLSRGPLLGLVLAGMVAASFYSLWARRAFAVAAAAGLLAAVFGWSTLIELLDRTDRHDQTSGVVEVDGEFEHHSGSRNRLFVVRIYGPLVLRGGAFGFGTPAVSSFPPKIPGLPASARSREVLGIVDNSFILIGLRFGIVGLGLLVLLLGSTIYYAFLLARQMSLVTYPNGSGFLVALASILIGVSAEILTVFSSYEFFFWILFTCGVVSGLASLDLRSRLGEVQID